MNVFKYGDSFSSANISSTNKNPPIKINNKTKPIGCLQNKSKIPSKSRINPDSI